MDSGLNWKYVALTDGSAGQLFAYIPVLIGTAVGISGTCSAVTLCGYSLFLVLTIAL
jgi:hypothetical protein